MTGDGSREVFGPLGRWPGWRIWALAILLNLAAVAVAAAAPGAAGDRPFDLGPERLSAAAPADRAPALRG